MRSQSVPVVDEHERAIFAVVSVFNRIEHTRACLNCLLEQSLPVTPIVVDGGSTDGTVERIPREFPKVVMLAGLGDLWWGGATAAGIDWALANGARDRDFILLVNNDTVFESGTLAFLRETSERHQAAVGALVVDKDNDAVVIDGGVNIRWKPYGFRATNDVSRATPAKLDCDVLPGRCTLIPVVAVRRAGNVDARSFPHYLADYEFSHRLKRYGAVRLAVDYRAVVKTTVEAAAGVTSEKSGRDALRDAFNRRSKSNVVDHLRFVLRHAPLRYRYQIAGRQVTVLLLRLLPARPRARMGPLALRFRLLYSVIRGFSSAFRGFLRQPQPWLARLHRLRAGSYLVNSDDCRRHGLRLESLVVEGTLQASGFPGHYFFTYDTGTLPEPDGPVAHLRMYASTPWFKLRRFLELRVPGHAGSPSGTDVNAGTKSGQL